MECNSKEEKKQIVDLESRFQLFVGLWDFFKLLSLIIVFSFVCIQLKNRDELKQKFKNAEQKCQCLQETNKNLEFECEKFKMRVETVLKDNEDYATQKVSYLDKICYKWNLNVHKNSDTVGNRTKVTEAEYE